MNTPTLLTSLYARAEEAARELVALAVFSPDAQYDEGDYQRVIMDLANVAGDSFDRAIKATEDVKFTPEQEHLLDVAESTAWDRSERLMDAGLCLGLALGRLVDVAAVVGRR